MGKHSENELRCAHTKIASLEWYISRPNVPEDQLVEAKAMLDGLYKTYYPDATETTQKVSELPYKEHTKIDDILDVVESIESKPCNCDIVGVLAFAGFIMNVVILCIVVWRSI